MVERPVRARVVGGFVAAALAVMAIGGGIAAAADNPVAISGFSFSPKDITIAVGDSVTWTNSDAQGHTATADDASFDTGTIGNGASASVTFSTAGSFAYHCSIHPAMTGTVTVQAAAATPAPTPAPTNPPTDTGPEVDPASSGLAAAALVVAAWLVGLAIARRRLGRE